MGDMTTDLRVPDASCGHCKSTIEAALGAVDGVTGAELDLETKRLTVEHRPSVDDSVLKQAVAEAGYTAEDVALPSG